MGLMELIGQAEGTTLYGDRSAELVSGGGVKLFRAPFHGYLIAVSSNGKATNFTVAINGKPINVFGPSAVFRLGDTISVIGTPMKGASADRIGLEVGVLHDGISP